ncbi:MAG TPA: FHA domain-containing protein [Gaiellaceae bacterium]|nr:FHA domain-containing protein [Gaiellaceae bacterium]
MIFDSVGIEGVLLGLKIAFLVLLYLFIWSIARSASKDIRPAQESMILRPGDPGSQQLAAARRASAHAGRLIVVSSPSLAEGSRFAIDSVPLAIGRGQENQVALGEDEFASSAHARVEPRHDGAWLVDRGSTNGTFVNGVRIDGPHRLEEGDLVRIGETQLRYEP